jgi:hypothetical protein
MLGCKFYTNVYAIYLFFLLEAVNFRHIPSTFATIRLFSLYFVYFRHISSISAIFCLLPPKFFYFRYFSSTSPYFVYFGHIPSPSSCASLSLFSLLSFYFVHINLYFFLNMPSIFSVNIFLHIPSLFLFLIFRHPTTFRLYAPNSVNFPHPAFLFYIHFILAYLNIFCLF